MRILVVDDESNLCRLVAKALERAGYQVDTAENGRAALDAFRRQPADLVVTDLIMPEKEGIETIMELRGLSRDVKIIAMSGGGRSGPETYLELARNLGAADVLTKPFDLAELLSMVDRLRAEMARSGSLPESANRALSA